jgi:acyl-CoA thioesterase
MLMNPFDYYYEQVKSKGDLNLDPTWGQGKTTYGGMSAALGLAAIERDLTAQRGGLSPLRSISVHFCGALNTQTPFTTDTRVLKAGRSVVHAMAEIHQNEGCATTVTACYGAGRESNVVVAPESRELGEPGSGQRLSYIQGVTPEFVKHIDFSYVSGGLPFSNSQHDHIHGWMRFNDCESNLSEVHLVALIDAWPPTTLQKLKTVAPCASITWSLEIVTPVAALSTPIAGNDWLYYEAEIAEAHDGFAHTTARIYTSDGTLIALSRQLVVVYDVR